MLCVNGVWCGWHTSPSGLAGQEGVQRSDEKSHEGAIRLAGVMRLECGAPETGMTNLGR